MIDYKTIYSTVEIRELCKALDINGYEIGKNTKLTQSAVAKLLRGATKDAQRETRQVLSDYINSRRRIESKSSSSTFDTDSFKDSLDERYNRITQNSESLSHEAKILIESLVNDVSDTQAKDKLTTFVLEIIRENLSLKKNHLQVSALLAEKDLNQF